MEKSKLLELEELNNYYNSEDSKIVIVYGHIKTGSVTVLTEFAKGKETKYYFACSAAERLQQYIWGEQIRTKGISIQDYPSYTEIFEKYEKYCIEIGKPLAILIENFEDILKSSPDFIKDVSEIIYRKSHPKMMLVLLGNNSAWIENSMVEKIGTSASYISGFLKIKPYSFQEMRMKFINMSDRDAVSTFSIFGGKYSLWAYFDGNKSFKENVCNKFLDVNDSVLVRMTSYTLEENLRETAVYNTILFGLANGQNKLNDIHHATGFSRAKIMVYLKSLIDLGFVEKVYSFATTGHENVQKGVYRICDPLAHFFYKFIYKHISQLISLKPEEFYDKYIEPEIGEFVRDAYKLVCKEYVMKLSAFNRLPFEIEEEGEWVGKMGSIDIVAQSDTGDTLVGLCTWDKPFDVNIMEYLRDCCKRARITPDYYYLFSAAGFDEGLVKLAKETPQIKLIALDKMINE